jgi:aminotransferase
MDMLGMISPLVKHVPPSGIRKYFDMINELKDVISLGVGEPDFVTPLNIREAGIHSLEKGDTHYTPNAGYRELREEISKYIRKKIQVEYNPNNEIIVTVGGSEAIDISLRALLGPGDEVIIPEPSFVAYKPCTIFTGATPVIVNLKAKEQFRLTPEALEAAITPKTKVLILPYPNNPTGAIMGREDLAKLAKILKNKDIVVISDEIYSELTYEGEHVSIASFPGMKEKTVVINGFSKAFAMTGWRLGYACGHADLIGAMLRIHQYTIMSSPTIAQKAALEALKNSDNDVKKMVNEYNTRRKVMLKGFRELGYNCFEPLGAFYVFPDIRNSKLNSDEFSEGLLFEEKVLVIPGSAFGQSGEGFIRVTYANSMENIVEAMKRIKRFSQKN